MSRAVFMAAMTGGAASLGLKQPNWRKIAITLKTPAGHCSKVRKNYVSFYTVRVSQQSSSLQHEGAARHPVHRFGLAVHSG